MRSSSANFCSVLSGLSPHGLMLEKRNGSNICVLKSKRASALCDSSSWLLRIAISLGFQSANASLADCPTSLDDGLWGQWSTGGSSFLDLKNLSICSEPSVNSRHPTYSCSGETFSFS